MDKQEIVNKFLEAMESYGETGFDDSLWILHDEICEEKEALIHGNWANNTVGYHAIANRPTTPQIGQIIDHKDMVDGMVVKCFKAEGDWYNVNEVYAVGTDGRDFGPLDADGYTSPEQHKYKFTLVSMPETKQDPRICIDASNFDEDKKKRVIDAFYELWYEWLCGNKYQYLGSSTYTNSDTSGELDDRIMHNPMEPSKIERQYEHTYEQLMQRAYGSAGHPDEPRKTVEDAVSAHPDGWGSIYSGGGTAVDVEVVLWDIEERRFCQGCLGFCERDFYLVCTREEFEACVAKSEPEWTHTYLDEKCRVALDEPDCDGWVVIIVENSGYDTCHPRNLDPIKPTITKAQAEERLGMTITD